MSAKFLLPMISLKLTINGLGVTCVSAVQQVHGWTFFYLFRVRLDLNLLKRVLLLKMNEESTESTKNIKWYTQNIKAEWLNDREYNDWLEQDKKK